VPSDGYHFLAIILAGDRCGSVRVLLLGPREAELVELEDVLQEFQLFGPQEVKPVKLQGIQAILSETLARHEVGRRGRKGGKGKQRVLGNAADVAKVLRKGGWHGTHFPGNLLVCERGRVVLKRTRADGRRLISEIKGMDGRGT
jgi:hypothetical protein